MTSRPPSETFDLIIIGAGTAGSVLAARLSSDPTLRILVLEAGKNRNDDPNVRIPGFMGNLHKNPDYDWQFQTAPEAGLNGRVILQPRGRLWGGSSAINSHALVYPSRGYHNAWGTLIGNGSGGAKWDWEGIGKYYKKFQHVQKPSENAKKELDLGFYSSANDMDGEKGNSDEVGIRATFPVTPHVLQKAWSNAIQALGLNTTKDPLDGEAVGGSTTMNAVNVSTGERSHAGIAFLDPVAKRENLVIKSNVLVEKIFFDENKLDGKLVATDVLYVQEGTEEKITVHASKEVIVSAGSFGSPKILELSGIGQRQRLHGLGIKCVQDLQGVGENLQDHLNFGPSIEVHDHIQTADTKFQYPSIQEEAKKLYAAEHRGPLAEGAAYSFSYLPLQALGTQEEEEELEKIMDRTLKETSSTTNKGLKAQYEIIQRIVQDPKEATGTLFLTRMQRYSLPERIPGNFMTIIAMLSYPFSRGSSHITSADPSTPPEIKFNYLQHPLDVEVLGRHVLQIGKLLQQPSLYTVQKPKGKTLPPGYPRGISKVEEVEGYLRQYGATNYHPAGTCAMMREELGGVVDDSLIVYGTMNLRVCDASIIPIIPRGNILSTVYALAEKGADIIKESLQA